MTNKDLSGWDRLEWRRHLEILDSRNGQVSASGPKREVENLWYTSHSVLVMVKS